MNYNVSDSIMLQDLIKTLLTKILNPYTIISLLYLLFITIFIFHLSLKKIFLTIGSIILIALIYFLISDITSVHYLLSLHLNDNFRLLLNIYLPSFSISKHAPSKAMPSFGRSQFKILQIKWNNSPIIKASYHYLTLLQQKLLYIVRVLILILDFPPRKFTLKNGKIKINDWCYFFEKLQVTKYA